MNIYNQILSIQTGRRNQFLNITQQLAAEVELSGIREGQMTLFCPHTTAAVTVNESADPDVVHDILLTLEQVIPHNRPGYRHDEGNSDAHLKSSIFGCSTQLIIRNSKITLGTWQAVYFCEFDGPRSRNLYVQLIGK